jgi:uncharacterized lipoprotein
MRPPVFLTLSLAIVAGCSTSSTTPSPAPANMSEDALVARARAIHDRALTIDTHKDIPDNYATPAADPKTMNAQSISIK